MDRYCGFCVNIRSVVYCKADAAYLCLSCDSKVHSANPCSYRHYRNLICESCRRRPSYVRCYDHEKFMCRGCDLTQHNASSKHRKKVVKSYVGCPSARDLGLLWDFDLNQFIDGSRILEHKLFLETNKQIKGIDGGVQGLSVLEQLVDLLKVQTCVMGCQQHERRENKVDQFSQQLLVNGEHFIIQTFPFTQLDHLESSETNEESCVSSSQLWCHNMQDLGVCEEPSCLDDLDIPDIDHTFRNFEELFRIEEEPTRVDQTLSLWQDTSIESSPKKARYTSQNTSFSFSSSDTACTEPSKLEGNKIIQLKGSEQGQCGNRKAPSDTRKRTKSQSWKFKSRESATRSC